MTGILNNIQAQLKYENAACSRSSWRKISEIVISPTLIGDAVRAVNPLFFGVNQVQPTLIVQIIHC